MRSAIALPLVVTELLSLLASRAFEHVPLLCQHSLEIFGRGVQEAGRKGLEAIEQCHERRLRRKLSLPSSDRPQNLSLGSHRTRRATQASTAGGHQRLYPPPRGTPRAEICCTAHPLPSGSLKKKNPTLSSGSG